MLADDDFSIRQAQVYQTKPKRAALWDSEQHNTYIIEDDVYEWSLLWRTPTPLKAFDKTDSVLLWFLFQSLCLATAWVGWSTLLQRCDSELQLLYPRSLLVRQFSLVSHFLIHKATIIICVNYVEISCRKARFLEVIEQYFPTLYSTKNPGGYLFGYVHCWFR